jgi:hypothetical protein
MKKDNLLRCIAIFSIAILALLSAPELKAQGDILDESSNISIQDGFCDPGTYEINFDFNTSDSDTTVIFTNTSCYVKLVPGSGAQYAFCTAHSSIGECMNDETSGVFDITFKDNVASVGVHKISFIIYVYLWRHI